MGSTQYIHRSFAAIAAQIFTRPDGHLFQKFKIGTYGSFYFIYYGGPTIWSRFDRRLSPTKRTAGCDTSIFHLCTSLSVVQQVSVILHILV